MKKLIVALVVLFVLTGCEIEKSGTREDINNTISLGGKLSDNQPTPTDIDYSIERYNLTKRTYWVNGQREKANSLTSKVPLPLGYVVLFSSNSVVASFSIEGKVSSLNSFLTPDYTVKFSDSTPVELPDVDGSYGENDNGIFFFTVDGKYVEWSGDYLYSDIPIFVDNPIIKVAN